MRFLFLIFFFTTFCRVESKSEALRIGLLDSRPFYWKTDGKPTGFHFDVAESLANKLGRPLLVKEAPILRIIKMLKKGEVDIVIVTDHKELESMKVKKELLLELNSFIFTRADQPIASKNEIKGTIARLSNSCSSLENHPGIEWLDAESYEQAYGLLKLKRIRGVCGTIAFQIIVNNKMKTDPVEVKSFLVSKRNLSVQARPDLDAIQWAEIQKAVSELVKSGVVNNFAKKYSK